jgi:Zn-finger nucleic acid-binding protein
MKCPNCSSDLNRSQYEGLPVFSCADCSGYLVSTRRVTHINRRRIHSADELTEEAITDVREDREHSLRCPRCMRQMDKELCDQAKSFHIDKCVDCELVWFDAGELARSQLAYESTERAQETRQFQERHLQMTSDERKEFEHNLASLPEGEASLESEFGQGLIGSLVAFARELRRQH